MRDLRPPLVVFPCLYSQRGNVPRRRRCEHGCKKRGNSLALRIPRAFAAEARLLPNTPVDLALDGEKLVVSPIQAAPAGLEDLLAGVTEENLHGEVDTGPPAGREAW